MSSGVIHSFGSTNDPLPTLPENVVQSSGEIPEAFSIEDIQRRLRMAFGAVNGIDAGIDEAQLKAMDAADAWEEAILQNGEGRPSPREYDKMLTTNFWRHLFRLELSKKLPDGHRDLLAGRTNNNEELFVIDREGNSISTRPRQRWEFTKALLRSVLDPAVSDSALKKFTDDCIPAKHGGQGLVRISKQRGVAVKSLDAQSGINVDNDARFQREKIALRHVQSVAPGISPKLLGEGIERDREMIFMEKVPGKNLQEQFEDLLQLPLQKKYALARRLIRLIQRAQEAGILHRDIKAANIMYDVDTDTLTLLDFGLSRFRHNDGTSNIPYDPTVTRPGAIFGSAEYIDPLQARDASIPDPRFDLYPLALIIYKLLTGVGARKTPKDGEQNMNLFLQVSQDGFVEDLPALHRSGKNARDEVAKQIAPEAAQALEILLRRRKVIIPLVEEEHVPLPPTVNAFPVRHGTETFLKNTKAETQMASSAESQSISPPNATVDFSPEKTKEVGTIAFEKLESPEERRKWLEAQQMIQEALKYFDTLEAGGGNAVVLRGKRKMEKLLSDVKRFFLKPWMVVAEVITLIAGFLLLGSYLANRKPEDPSEVVVRLAEDPDPTYFQISSVGFADGSEDLVLQMPLSSGIPPEQLKSGVHYWRTDPDGQKTWVGLSTAIPRDSLRKYFGEVSSQMQSESQRLFHVKAKSANGGYSTYTWSSGGYGIFRPAGGKARASYGTGGNVSLKNTPMLKYAEKSREWMPGMLSDPEFQDFILSLVVEGIEIGNMNQKPFEAANIDVLSKERNLNVFINPLKSNQSTVKKLRALKNKENNIEKKISSLRLNHLRDLARAEAIDAMSRPGANAEFTLPSQRLLQKTVRKGRQTVG